MAPVVQARLATLEGALAIGRRADVPAPEEVRTRLEGVQQRAASPTSKDEHPLITTVQGWLAGYSRAPRIEASRKAPGIRRLSRPGTGNEQCLAAAPSDVARSSPGAV